MYYLLGGRTFHYHLAQSCVSHLTQTASGRCASRITVAHRRVLNLPLSGPCFVYRFTSWGAGAILLRQSVQRRELARTLESCLVPEGVERGNAIYLTRRLLHCHSFATRNSEPIRQSPSTTESNHILKFGTAWTSALCQSSSIEWNTIMEKPHWHFERWSYNLRRLKDKFGPTKLDDIVREREDFRGVCDLLADLK